jgi:hypothetical protein
MAVYPLPGREDESALFAPAGRRPRDRADGRQDDRGRRRIAAALDRAWPSQIAYLLSIVGLSVSLAGF